MSEKRNTDRIQLIQLQRLSNPVVRLQGHNERERFERREYSDEDGEIGFEGSSLGHVLGAFD
jgi:hypothetical protein